MKNDKHDRQVTIQATVNAMSTGGPPEDTIRPHHPISCLHGNLTFDNEGILACDHAIAPAGNCRVQLALNHSILILLFEEVMKRYESEN